MPFRTSSVPSDTMTVLLIPSLKSVIRELPLCPNGRCDCRLSPLYIQLIVEYIRLDLKSDANVLVASQDVIVHPEESVKVCVAS